MQALCLARGLSSIGRPALRGGSVIPRPLPGGEGEVEIGWQLHPDSWGNGFASEAVSSVLDRGFADGVPEVWAVTHLDNTRSVAVCRRIGMQLLGIAHRWYHEPSLMFWIGSRPDDSAPRALRLLPRMGEDPLRSADLMKESGNARSDR